MGTSVPPDPARKAKSAGPRKVKPARPAVEPDTPKRSQGWPWLWIVVPGVMLFALVGIAGIGIAAYFFYPRAPKVAKEEAPVTALQRLGEAQRAWWEKEGFSSGTATDPEGAFSRLGDVQREWWEQERLGSAADLSGGPLARLESMEQQWWQEEGLSSGKAGKNADATLGRLATINQEWWTLAQPTPRPASATEEEPDASGPAVEDVSVELRDQAGTRHFLEAGGSADSEKAVQLGLSWIASQQLPDGRWSFVSNGKPPPNHPDTAATAMALLPFLARGYTHKSTGITHPYMKKVDAGLQYLLKQQKPTGDLRGGGNLYTHALATMALCEACNMTSDQALRDPCQKALAFIVSAQGANGGWRYTPKQAGDLSVTSWNLMALKSGQMAGFTIPKETLARASRYLESVKRSDGGYNYIANQPGHSPPTPAPMTAAGLVCAHYLHHDSNQTKGVDLILRLRPNPKRPNYYYLYYSVYALFPVGGEAWKSWNPPVRDLLVGLQNKGNQRPALKGSWDPRGGLQLDRAGRLAVTSMALLTLEVYYRHLPLNQPDLGQMTKDDLSKTSPRKK